MAKLVKRSEQIMDSVQAFETRLTCGCGCLARCNCQTTTQDSKAKSNALAADTATYTAKTQKG